MQEPTTSGREDLTAVPLITIDPVDARDHDDAVWATPDKDPGNRDGWIVMVAIADVAHYVRPASALDREALKRGNSVYFPDRVVPMLPERISNDLCSLREKELRPCLAVRMVFDKTGKKQRHTFLRGMMRSAAKLAYEQAQTAVDGTPDEVTAPLLEPVLRPLWDAYACLKKARDARQPLDLDLPERKILMDDQGRIKDIVTPPRLDAHRLIEEFMIQANVCAAESLEAKRSPLIYRVHESPPRDKLTALSEFLQTIDMRLPKTGRITPKHFNTILSVAEDTDVAEVVNEVVLRSQTQAEYSPENVGHFGLNLSRYAHFTSPIRRYADLIVHRALIAALGLGAGGLSKAEAGELTGISKSISEFERRAMMAERETVDRLIAQHLANDIGATFAGRVAGVTRSGLFVRLTETGADGFIPAATIGREYFFHDERHQALIGEDTRQMYRLGQVVQVRLVEAIPSAGAMRFEVLSEGVPAPQSARRRPANRNRNAGRGGRGRKRVGGKGRKR